MINTLDKCTVFLFMLFCMGMGFPAYAEESVQEQITEQALESDHKHYLTLSVENDLFASGTDQNYTSGLRLSLFEIGQTPPGVTKNLEKIWPYLDINESTSVTYSLGQNLYTPDQLNSPTQDVNDRPWAAFLYGSMSMVTLSEEHLDEYEITLGVVGPLALGEPVQKAIHDIVDSDDPQGWDNQLENEPGLILSWQRRWPAVWYQELGETFLSFVPHAGATVGNIYTYANAGGSFKIASEEGRWADRPIRVRPAMPGTGYFPEQELGWEVFAGFDGRAIARNIFLDGNTFTDSHHVDKNYFVSDINVGVALTMGQTRLSYTVVYRTEEFKQQKDPTLFGAVSVGYNF